MVEGEKSVLELFKSDFNINQLLATSDFLKRNGSALKGFRGDVLEVKSTELAEASEYSTNDAALAVVQMKPNVEQKLDKYEFALVLDDIRDPGNLGTIIRIADWYGINKIIASEETTDVYNSKVIQSTMGSFTRVNIFYANLIQYLSKNEAPIFGAFLDGDNVHKMDFGSGGMIVIGNEANGISVAVEKFVTKRITIPRFGHAESLNAAIATAVICDNIKRK